MKKVTYVQIDKVLPNSQEIIEACEAKHKTECPSLTFSQSESIENNFYLIKLDFDNSDEWVNSQTWANNIVLHNKSEQVDLLGNNTFKIIGDNIGDQMAKISEEKIYDTLMEMNKKLASLEQMLKSKIDSDDKASAAMTARVDLSDANYIKLEKRVDKLEKWQAGVIAISAFIASLISITIPFLLKIMQEMVK